MKIGIVGAGADKFTPEGMLRAREAIRAILLQSGVTHVVSGHSPLGGVDLWAEEIGAELGLVLDIKAPREQSWSGRYGYRARNLDIARSSDQVCVIVAKDYPSEYKGRRFETCYHCVKHHRGQVFWPSWHCKSGGCWTGWQAVELGKSVEWVMIDNGVAMPAALQGFSGR